MLVHFEVNGSEVEVEVEPRLTLADCLRHRLRLTGTHVGCEHGVCGACTVIVDGAAVRSCLMLAVQAAGVPITTVEGMATEGVMHPIQEAMWDAHSFQCGFCTPGFVLMTHQLLAHNPDPSEDDIRHYLSGNLCRCAAYTEIIDAVRLAAKLQKQSRANPSG